MLTIVLAFLGGIGMPELLVILMLVIVLFGAKKIPDLARGMGRGIREFKDATKDINDEITEAGKEIKKD